MANSTRSTFPIARLSSYLRFRVACFQGVHVSQYEISGPVGLELFLILSFDDGEGAEDVISVFAGDPIKVEVQGVEPGPVYVRRRTWSRTSSRDVVTPNCLS